MNEVVMKYIEQKLSEKRAAENKHIEREQNRREQFLIDEGIFEKIYLDSDEYDDEYPEIEYLKSGDFKYYKKVMIDLTDEEWEEIKKVSGYTEKVHNDDENANPIAKLLQNIAIGILAAGVLEAVIMIIYALVENNGISAVLALAVFTAHFISSAMVRGFAEIIRLLADINKKLK